MLLLTGFGLLYLDGTNLLNTELAGKSQIQQIPFLQIFQRATAGFFIKENINFCFYSRGSVLETKNWISKCVRRNLISEEDSKSLLNELEIIHKKLNGYIKVLRQNLNKQK